MIVLQQWLSRHFGYRRYLTAALGLFIVGSLISAASNDLPTLTLARLVQGFGGGALFTSCRILVLMLFGPKDRPLALKYFMLVVFAMSAGAPVLAGTLVDEWGWRWVFLAVVPLALLALAGAWTLLPADLGRGGEPVKWAAAAQPGPLLLFAAAITLRATGTFAGALRLLRASLASAGHRPAAGIALLAVGSSTHQWRHEEPLLRVARTAPPRLFDGVGPLFPALLACRTPAAYLFPIYAERGLGIPIHATGWLNSFAALVSLAVAYAYIKRGARIPRKKPLMAAGAMAMAIAAWMFSTLPPGAPAAALLLALVAKGVFGVLVILPVGGVDLSRPGR